MFSHEISTAETLCSSRYVVQRKIIQNPQNQNKEEKSEKIELANLVPVFTLNPNAQKFSPRKTHVLDSIIFTQSLNPLARTFAPNVLSVSTLNGARTGVLALQRSGLFSSALQHSDLFFISAPALRLPSPLHAPIQFCLALQRSESFCQALQRSNVPFRSIFSTFHGRNYSKDRPIFGGMI